jgi:phytanoyl-CoA hydroxylase
MPYPTASPEQIAFFREHGWIVVKDALPAAELDLLESFCDRLLAEKERLAKDWAWDASESLDER